MFKSIETIVFCGGNVNLTFLATKLTFITNKLYHRIGRFTWSSFSGSCWFSFWSSATAVKATLPWFFKENHVRS